MNNLDETKLQEEIITIKGMHCKSCVEKIKTKLSQLRGVNGARVSLVEEKAYVQFDSKETDTDTIKTEIRKLGYKIAENGGGEEVKIEKIGLRQGLVYGLIPHIGCIAFIVFSILGVTTATAIFRPLLLNPYFFYILIALSFVFATISAIIYLKKQGFITAGKSEDGIKISFARDILKRKWKYISTMYGTTIFINLLLFMVVFPLAANFSYGSTNIVAGPTGAFVAGEPSKNSLSSLTLQVAIPCSGHAPLITENLKKINGIQNIKFRSPNLFDVSYDPTKTTKQEILSLEIFNTYKATAVSENQANLNDQQKNNNVENTTNTVSGGGCCGGSGGCGCGGAGGGGCGVKT